MRRAVAAYIFSLSTIQIGRRKRSFVQRFSAPVHENCSLVTNASPRTLPSQQPYLTTPPTNLFPAVYTRRRKVEPMKGTIITKKKKKQETKREKSCEMWKRRFEGRSPVKDGSAIRAPTFQGRYKKDPVEWLHSRQRCKGYGHLPLARGAGEVEGGWRVLERTLNSVNAAEAIRGATATQIKRDAR